MNNMQLSIYEVKYIIKYRKHSVQLHKYDEQKEMTADVVAFSMGAAQEVIENSYLNSKNAEIVKFVAINPKRAIILSTYSKLQ